MGFIFMVKYLYFLFFQCVKVHFFWKSAQKYMPILKCEKCVLINYGLYEAAVY